MANGFRTLACGLFLYALGGYIKKYNPFEKIEVWVLIVLIAGLYTLIYISYYNVVANSIHSYLMNNAAQKANGQAVDVFLQPFLWFDNFGSIPVILAIVLFELFSRFRIPSNRVINFVAGGTFIIYLIHDNEFWRCIWRERDWVKTLSENPLIYCYKLCKWTVFVFCVGLLIYCLYLGLGKVCVRFKGEILKPEDGGTESGEGRG